MAVSLETPLEPIPQIDACQPTDRSRFKDCKTHACGWNIRRDSRTAGQVIGTAQASITISETVAADSRQWVGHYTVHVEHLTGVAERGTTASIVPQCLGACSVTGAPTLGSQPVFENSGRQLQEFYRVNHILDGDPFYVQP